MSRGYPPKRHYDVKRTKISLEMSPKMEASTSESCFTFSDVEASHSESESDASEVNVNKKK